jgi:hypothetical protein
MEMEGEDVFKELTAMKYLSIADAFSGLSSQRSGRNTSASCPKTLLFRCATQVFTPTIVCRMKSLAKRPFVASCLRGHVHLLLQENTSRRLLSLRLGLREPMAGPWRDACEDLP